MDKEAVLEILRRFAESLARHGALPCQLILFGSYARGDYREGSDIDVVVVSSGIEGKSYWERIEIFVACIYELRKPIEAIAMTPEEWERGDSMIAQIAREGGEVVYAAA